MIGGHLFCLESGAIDEIEKLHAEENLSVITEFDGQFRSHSSEILMLLERLSKEFSQF